MHFDLLPNQISPNLCSRFLVIVKQINKQSDIKKQAFVVCHQRCNLVMITKYDHAHLQINYKKNNHILLHYGPHNVIKYDYLKYDYLHKTYICLNKTTF